MDRLDILGRREAKALLEKMRQQWDASLSLDFVFLSSSSGRVYVARKESFGVDLSKLKVDSLGLYFGTLEKDGLRLSIEGSQLVGPSAGKNVLDLDDPQARLWLSGSDVETGSGTAGLVIVRHGRDYLGCGRQKGGVLRNFYPKSRRISPS